ncbi:hypothetical protein TNCV_1446941 [Trichonephila clavipes]|nr:hypothetical protein TNCV_1446941 [Trichonephila clavipes]
MLTLKTLHEPEAQSAQTHIPNVGPVWNFFRSRREDQVLSSALDRDSKLQVPFLAIIIQFEREIVVAEWSRYQIVADHVTSSSPVLLKTRRVEQRCTLNLWRAQTPSHWCSVVVRKGGAS